MTDSDQALASRSKRLAGALIDSFIMMSIMIPVAILAGVFEQVKLGRQMSIGQYIFLFFSGLFFFFAINGFFLAKGGQTVGKKIAGTRVVDFESGEIISIWKYLGVRLLPIHIASQIPVAGSFIGLVDIICIFGKDKRCFHDLIAGTKVVDIEKQVEDLPPKQNDQYDFALMEPNIDSKLRE